MLNSNMVITDCNKNKDDTVIQGNIKNKEINESINNNDMDRFKNKNMAEGDMSSYGRLYVGTH